MKHKLSPAQQKQHPGYQPGVHPEPDCGCRGHAHWCAKHQHQAARDAGQAATERATASKK